MLECQRSTLSIIVHKSETPIGCIFSNWMVLIYKTWYVNINNHTLSLDQRTYVRMTLLFYIQYLISKRNELLQLKNQPVCRNIPLSRLFPCQWEVEVSRVVSNSFRKMIQAPNSNQILVVHELWDYLTYS